MSKPKKKLTAAQRAAKKRRSKKFEIVFINGKQVRVRRPPPTIDGLDQNEFLLRNADPVWLEQNGYYDLLHMRENEAQNNSAQSMPPTDCPEDLDDIPF